MFVCLWSPTWSTGGAPASELTAALLELAPRVVVGPGGRVWAEGSSGLAGSLLARAGAAGMGEAGAGAAAMPIVAWVAARTAECGGVVEVEPGGEREFLASRPVALLEPGERLMELLEGVGIGRCGELAALEREAVEVRFGPEGVALWRLSRAEDPRRLFPPMPRELPHASLDFVDYVLTDPSRLIFTANALLGSVCEALRDRGRHARRLVLALALANGEEWRRSVRAVRPTANRETWLRRLRGELERLTVPDAVAGMSLWVESTGPAAVRQGDLFDRGFATAAGVESAVARLLEEQGEVVVVPETCGHPLAERRTRWRARAPEEVAEGTAPSCRSAEPPVSSPDPALAPAGLTLQLLPAPCPVAVETMRRRDHVLPVRIRRGGEWRALLTAAGPDRVSGGRWEAVPFAREYFRCVSDDGLLLWVYRDAREDAWYLHGWWD